MGTNRIRLAGQGRRSRSNGDRQSLVCRSCPLDRPDRLPVARFAEGVRPMPYGVHAFLQVASQGCVGTRDPRRGRRNRDQACVDRFDHRARTPAFVRSSKKNGPQALGRSRGGLTTKLHLAVDDAGRPLRLIATEGQVPILRARMNWLSICAPVRSSLTRATIRTPLWRTSALRVRRP